jgi:hypothetical protein
MSGLPYPVRFIESGPFRGRAYAIMPDGSTGHRVRELEPHPRHATRGDKKALERMVRAIPDQATLDAILAKEPDMTLRAAILEQWSQWLSFVPTVSTQPQ